MGVASLTRLSYYDPSTMSDPRAADPYRIWLMFTPIFLGLLGLAASYMAIHSMNRLKGKDPAAALRQVSFIASGIFLALALVFILIAPIAKGLWVCVLVGTVCGMGIGLLTEYFTAGKPIYQIIEASKTGPATCIINGIAVGFQSCAFPILLIVIAVIISNQMGGFYGVSRCRHVGNGWYYHDHRCVRSDR
jgi:K(+)-stimulated pyrophosphate-energized sodium pump